MEKKRKVGFEQEKKPKRKIELYDPVPEAERLLFSHPELLIEARELNVIYAREDEEAPEEAKAAYQELAQRVKDKNLETGQEKMLLRSLLDQLEPSLAWKVTEPEAVKSMADASLASLEISKADRQEITARIDEISRRIERVEAFAEQHPQLNEHGEKILEHIEAFLESNNKEEQEMAEQEIRGLLSEISRIAPDDELKTALFHSMAERIAEAWGHNEFVARSLGENYLLLKRMGYGVSGEAYAALGSDGSEAVVKVLAPRNPESKERIEVDRSMAVDFQREIDVLRQIDHPNVVKFIHGEMVATDRNEDGEPVHEGWYSMEQLPGKELKELMREGLVPVEQALRILSQASKGLSALHERGIIHRDVKPHNILVDLSKEQPDVHLIDFGIVLADDEQRQEQKVYGTPLYASPEHLVAEDMTDKSDMYSLGILAYELATGTHPFVDYEGKELYSNQIWLDVTQYEQLIPPSELAASRVSPELSVLILRMLSKNPDIRPTAADSASAFAILVQREQERAARQGVEDTMADTQPIARNLSGEDTIHGTPADAEQEDRDENIQLVESIIHTYPYDHISPAGVHNEMLKLNRTISYDEARKILQALSEGEDKELELVSGQTDRYRIVGLRSEREKPVYESKGLDPKAVLKELAAKPTGNVGELQFKFGADEDAVMSLLDAYAAGSLRSELPKGSVLYVDHDEKTYQFVQKKNWLQRLFSGSDKRI